MSQTMYGLRGGFIVERPERLPDGTHQDDVAAQLADHLQRAARDWYTSHRSMLACEPDVLLGS